ncbi:MAG: germination protein YpeB [Clostridia bacterium]|nr:germination protein YpeB [Clostridia bacterium]
MEYVERKKSNRIITTLSVFVAVLAIMTGIFGTLYAINRANYETTSVSLENVYQRSFYDLVDNVNNAETKLAKLLSTTDKAYSQKLLTEIHENTNCAQNNLSYLPISMNGISDTIKFINQIDGYTTTLAKNNKTLTTSDRETLSKLYDSIAGIKEKLNGMSQKFVEGYSVSANSKETKKEDYTSFTTLISSTKAKDTDYPTMIYDGPFSDTVVNKEIKGLSFAETSKEETEKVAANIYKDSEVSFAGEANGKFSTYDYNITLPNGIDCYAQICKKGGKLLTLSSYSDSDKVNFSKEQAITKAEEFAVTQGINDVKCVWSDVVGNDAYINLAPVKNNIIYYPDLIKVKVDLSSGEIIGWESATYYTNHKERNLPKPTISEEIAKSAIEKGYVIDTIKLALSPIEDYNQEVLTYEIKCTKNDSTYYFYVDVQTGETVNVLRVVETDNGNLLM